MREALGKVVTAAIVAASLATPAQAVVRPAATIDGPGTGVISLGGVAMAPDGTGGLVYLKTDQGEPHVFVSRFFGGRWLPPQRVDTGLPFDSSWPQIGAGDGGRLVVVWAQSFAKDPNGVPLRQMYSAALKPGSSSFLPQIAFDSNLATPTATGDEGVSELYPSLSMNAIGQAYLVYRVVTNACDNGCANPQQGTIYRPGDAFADFRLARFNGETWSVLGAINRNTAFSVRPGTSDNSPQVTIDSSGRGVVAFQEPDNSGFDRIWARRLFGSTIGQILQVSPSSPNGQPLDGDADAFSLGGTDNGGAAVAYRQQPPPGSQSTVPHELVNLLYPPLAAAAQFAGAEMIDGGAGGLGSPAPAMNDQVQFATAFAGNGALQLVGGEASGVTGTSSLGGTGSGVRPGLEIGPDGFTAAAWPATDAQGQPTVDVEQIPASGSRNLAQVAAGSGGAINDFTFSGSGQGDALIGFRQGVGAASQIAGAVVQGPPPPFAAEAPANYVNPAHAVITWLPIHRTLGNVTYSVVVDGIVRARGLTGTSHRLDPRGLQTGQYDVAVIATDDAGQRTVSFHTTLNIDASPQASATRFGRLVDVRVSDGRPGRCPGLDLSRTTVRFGDGSRPTRARAGRRRTAVVVFRHRFRHGGWFRIRVRARDRAGFAHDVMIRVRVP
jgi:hypothetical protein